MPSRMISTPRSGSCAYASKYHSHADGANGLSGQPPSASTVVPSSSDTAFRLTSCSGRKTIVPAGASSSSPSSVNRARPETTT